MSLLGLDVGISGCRALVISLDGTVLANIGRGYASPVNEMTCALDTRQIWGAVSRVLKEAASQSTKDPIKALAISSVGEAVIPLSRDGVVIGGCLLGRNTEKQDILSRLVEQLGHERIHDITGRVPEPSHTLSQLCWLREEDLDLYSSTWRFVLVGGLVAHLLGGSSHCDYSIAGGTLLFDIRQKSWSRDMLNACGLSAAKLPELDMAGTPIGGISNRIARDLSLPPDVTIVLGGHDLACNALGAGAARNGLAALDLGTSVHLTPVFHAVPLVSMMLRDRLSLESHVVPDLLLTDYYTRSGGALLRWFAHEITPLEQREAAKRGVSLYRVLMDEMPEKPTSLIVLPPLGDNEPQPGAILGLTLQTPRGELIKALLEGLMLYLAKGQGQLEQIGIRIARYRATGGGSRSDAWLQLAADILDRPVERTSIAHAAPLGAALLAGIGIGAYADYQEAIDAAVRVELALEPHPERTRIYAARLATYRELSSTLRNALLQMGDAHE